MMTSERNESVWVAEVFIHTDVPTFTKYKLVKRTKNGVQVSQYGSERLLRSSRTTKFFFSEEDASDWFRQFVQDRIAYHESRIQTCREDLAAGPCIHEQPHQAIKVKLRLE